MNKQIRRLTALLLILVTGSVGVQAQDNPDDWPNPPEPALKYKVTVDVTPKGAGNPSGAAKLLSGGQTTISTSDVVDYKFRYWTLNGTQYTTSRSFTYTVTNQDAQFVAVYEYDPEDPAEPTSNPTYRLYMDCQPTGACSFNRTSGLKTETGTQVYLSATPNQDFVFKGWYEGDTKVNSNISFTYLMTAADHHLVARFEYDPEDPDVPTSAGTGGVDNTEYTPGDVNGDGSVDVQDVVLTVNYVIGRNPENFIRNAADMNKDGDVDVQDVVLLVNKVIGKS